MSKMTIFCKGDENFRPTIVHVYRRKCTISEILDFTNMRYKEKWMKKIRTHCKWFSFRNYMTLRLSKNSFGFLLVSLPSSSKVKLLSCMAYLNNDNPSPHEKKHKSKGTFPAMFYKNKIILQDIRSSVTPIISLVGNWYHRHSLGRESVD